MSKGNIKNLAEPVTITSTDDGGFVVTICTFDSSSRTRKLHLIKFNKNGFKIWHKNYSFKN